MAQVPINPKVLSWAIEESGYDRPELAEELRVELRELDAWLAGQQQPSVTQFRKLATVLKRPTATFLLPAPPRSTVPQVEFRHPPDRQGRPLNPQERVRLREAGRLQKGLRWVVEELHDETIRLPTARRSSNPETVADKIRAHLGVDVAEQIRWKNDSQAFREWRRAVEQAGIAVLALPMGKDSSRGFSAWDDRIPVVAINTHWNPSARIFTLFHELGHLVTRTSSVCEEAVGYRHKDKADPVERWCESFATAVLMPWNDLERFLRDSFDWYPGRNIANLDSAKKVARRYRVSLRAAVLRLIDKNAAKWTLYRSIPASTETKSGGGGGSGRTRPEARLDEYGHRTARVFLRGLDRDVLSRDDVLSYLNIGDRELATFARTLDL